MSKFSNEMEILQFMFPGLKFVNAKNVSNLLQFMIACIRDKNGEVKLATSAMCGVNLSLSIALQMIARSKKMDINLTTIHCALGLFSHFLSENNISMIMCHNAVSVASQYIYISNIVGYRVTDYIFSFVNISANENVNAKIGWYVTEFNNITPFERFLLRTCVCKPNACQTSMYIDNIVSWYIDKNDGDKPDKEAMDILHNVVNIDNKVSMSKLIHKCERMSNRFMNYTMNLCVAMKNWGIIAMA